MEEILNNEQSLDDLRRRINAKAEKMMNQWKTDKKSCFFLIAIIALLLILEALNYHYGWIEVDWKFIPAILLFTIVASLVGYHIMKHFVNKMRSANGPAQQLQAAKRFMKTKQWGIMLCFIFIWAIGKLFYLERIGAIIFAICVLLLLGSILLRYMPNVFIDKDFYKDVEELEQYV